MKTPVIVAYIAMYRALEELDAERPDEALEEFLGSANPYLFADRKPADASLLSDFEELARRDVMAVSGSYEMVARYLERYPWGSRFSEISPGEWDDLCGIVADEESAPQVDGVPTFGFDPSMRQMLSGMSGKTLKSFEIALGDTLSVIDGMVRLNLGKYALDVCLFDRLRLVGGQEIYGRFLTCHEKVLGSPFITVERKETKLYLVDERIESVEIIADKPCSIGGVGVNVDGGLVVRTAFHGYEIRVADRIKGLIEILKAD